MNWIDFNIICVGARKPMIYNNAIYMIDIMNKNCNKSVKCYIENWDIINRIQGIWYELWSSENQYDDIIKTTWKLQNACDEDIHGYQLYIDETDRRLLYEVFDFYVQLSPIKKIIVLFRHQGYEMESLKSCMTIKAFLDKLINKEIYGNIAYIISN